MRATLCLAIAEPRNAMPSLSCVMLCLAVAVAVHCVAMPSLCFAMLCRCCAHLRCAMPSLGCSLPCSAVACLCAALPCKATPCSALAVQCYAALCLCTSKLCPALPLPCRQYADFLSALVRLPADLFRVKRLADRAFLHLADYVPPFDAVGRRVSPLSAPIGGACRVFSPLGM